MGVTAKLIQRGKTWGYLDEDGQGWDIAGPIMHELYLKWIDKKMEEDILGVSEDKT